MKKVLKSIIILVIAIASIFTLVSCGSGKIDIDEVAKTLSRNGYTIGDEWVDDDPSVTREIFITDLDTFSTVFRMTSYSSNIAAKIGYFELRKRISSSIDSREKRIEEYTEMLNNSTLGLTKEQRDDFSMLISKNKEDLERLQKTEIGITGNVIWRCSDEAILDFAID